MLAPMRRHAGAVILLGGWLFMIPPSTNRGGTVDLEAPLHTWLQYAAYDSREECFQALFNARNNALGETKNAAISAEPRKHAMYGRCVPAESVYPPQPTAPK